MTPKQYRALLNMPIQEQERTAKKDFMKSYKKRFLKTRPPKEERGKDISYRLDRDLVANLSLVTNKVFAGKISTCAFVNNILTDHIEQYSGFFDDVYKPAKTWRQ